MNQQTRTFPVEILVSNPTGRLKPGFFAKGAILTQRDENVLAGPLEAISTLAGVSSVFVIQEDGTIRQQNVALGVQEGNYFEIIDGLRGDEVLASSNLNEITTGMKVQISQGEAPSQTEGTPVTAAPSASPGEGQRRGTRGGIGGNE